jgi:hypothetical protein
MAASSSPLNSALVTWAESRPRRSTMSVCARAQEKGKRHSPDAKTRFAQDRNGDSRNANGSPSKLLF